MDNGYKAFLVLLIIILMFVAYWAGGSLAYTHCQEEPTFTWCNKK